MASWGILWKNEIHGFWDVKVGMASKCPQINTIKFLVHEIYELSGFCTWPSWLVWHDLARWLSGEFCKKLNSWFLRCEGWNGLQMSPNEYHKILGARMFWVWCVLNMAKLDVWHGLGKWLRGVFCEKMKFTVFEMWRLELPPNVPTWVP